MTYKSKKQQSIDDWTKKIWYLYIKEYYSAIKNDRFETCKKMDGPGKYSTE